MQNKEEKGNLRITFSLKIKTQRGSNPLPTQPGNRATRTEPLLRSVEQVLALSLSEETTLKILEIPGPLTLDKSFPADVPPDHKLVESPQPP